MITFKEINKQAIIYAATKHPFKLKPTMELSSEYSFGIEIEFEYAPLDNIKNIGKWTLEEETAVSKKSGGRIIGGELISPILTDAPSTWKDISSKCNKLVKNGAISTNYTGGHIHIGSQIIGDNPDNIRRFLKIWELFENIIYYFSYGYSNKHRLGINFYAKPIGKTLKRTRNSKNGYDQFKTYYHWIKYFKENQDPKHEGLSFQKFYGFEEDEGNTIEIRCPNGSLDPAIWQNNINFFIRLLLSSREQSCDEELIDHLLLTKGPIEYDVKNFNKLDFDRAILLSNMIYDNEIDKLSFLKQCLKLFTEEEKEKNHSV